MEKPLDQVSTAIFSTDAFTPEHRFEAWRTLLAASHDVEAEPAGFSASLKSIAVDRMLVSRMRAARQGASRSPRRTRRDGLEHVVLHLTSNAFDAETNGRAVHCPAGSVTVNTLSQPFRRGWAPEHDSVVVSLSRDLVVKFIPEPEHHHGLVLTEGLGLLLGEHMRALAAHGGETTLAAAPSLARATAALLAAALTPTPAAVAESRQARDVALLFRCRRFIERHLSDPALTPDLLCRTVGVSRSALFRLFEPAGGVATYIRSRRLEAVRAALLTAPPSTRIAELAHTFGFTNPAAFSRLFRTAFGMSPSELLEGAGQNRPHPDAAFRSDYGAWVRDLG